ncbi:MAG TPA: hypothetical protein VK469_07620 [Candidatus Kapabacteria bacterium]|nr:hypothetical protein [Candidatus Kapabacteria bacterium]
MMNDEKCLKSNDLEMGLAAEVITTIVDKAIKKYKIDAVTAAGIVSETIEKHPKFKQLLIQELTLKEILKTRVYDEIEKKARQKIYYELRQYQKAAETQEALIAELATAPRSAYKDIIARLVGSHVSTKERLSSLDIFYEELFKYIESAVSIVDIGCGLHPLLFPFAGAGNNITRYAALDKDKTSISALEVFSKALDKNILYPMLWHIKEGWRAVQEKTGILRFDVALLLKIVPVVYRIQRDLLPVLLGTPAETWIITGSRSSMTKYVDIEKRERKIIKQFVGQSRKQIIREFSTADEFCIIVK